MTYFEIGVSLSTPPKAARDALEEIGAILGVEPDYSKRFGLAGPNDLIHILLSYDLWQTLLPWAKAIGFGAAGFVGNHIVSKFIDSKVDKKLAHIDRKLDRLTELFDSIRTSTQDDPTSVAEWDVRFGFRSAQEIEIDPNRSMVGLRIDPNSITTMTDAILALSIVGSTVERKIHGFLEDRSGDQDTRRIDGVITVEPTGKVKVELRYRSNVLGQSTETLEIDPANELS